jgi:hypothetical protein
MISHDVVKVAALPSRRLSVQFTDGLSGQVEFRDMHLFGSERSEVLRASPLRARLCRMARRHRPCPGCYVRGDPGTGRLGARIGRGRTMVFQPADIPRCWTSPITSPASSACRNVASGSTRTPRSLISRPAKWMPKAALRAPSARSSASARENSGFHRGLLLTSTPIDRPARVHTKSTSVPEGVRQ